MIYTFTETFSATIFLFLLNFDQITTKEALFSPSKRH